MKNCLDKLPEEIITIIKDYTPRDKDMKAPTSSHIKSLLYYYNYDYERIYNLIDQDELVYFDPRERYERELFYQPQRNEAFYKYTLRIYKKQIKLNEFDKELYSIDITDNNN